MKVNTYRVSRKLLYYIEVDATSAKEAQELSFNKIDGNDLEIDTNRLEDILATEPFENENDLEPYIIEDEYNGN